MNERRQKILWMMFALAVAAGHLAVGARYWEQWVRQYAPPARPPLTLTGDDYLRTFPGWGTADERDSAAYNTAALNVLETGRPLTRSGAVYWRAPVYPYFLAGGYAVGGVRFWAVAIPQAMLAAVVAGLVVWIARQLAGPRAAIVAGLLYLVNLRFAMYVGSVYPTMLVMLAMAVAAGCVWRGWPLGVAVALLAGTFAQAAFFVLGGAGGLWLAWEYWRGRRPVVLIAAVALLAGCAGKLWLTTTAAGPRGVDRQVLLDRTVLWESNNPFYEGMAFSAPWEDRPGNPWTTWQPTPTAEARLANYLRRADGDAQHAAWLWIRENPGEYFRVSLVRLRTALGPTTGQMSPRHRRIATGVWWLVVPLSVLGLWRHRRQPLAQWTLFSVAGYVLFAALVYEDWYLRYRVPLEVSLIVLAGGAVAPRRS